MVINTISSAIVISSKNVLHSRHHRKNPLLNPACILHNGTKLAYIYKTLMFW